MAVLKDYYNTNDDDGALPVDDTTWQAMTFLASSDYDISSVKLLAYRTNSPGTITVSIRATTPSGGDTIPTGSNLVSGTTNGNTLTEDTAGEWREITFSSSYELVSGTTYAIVVGGAAANPNRIYLRNDASSPTYTDGNTAQSGNAGSTWSALNTRDTMFETWGVSSAPADKIYTRRLCTIAGRQFWYESSAGTMSVLSDANDDINAYNPLTAVEAYQKIFIANGTNLKVADFGNVKINTADAGANPCTPGMILTGGSSGAEMVVDYADGVTDDAAANVYGFRTTAASFSSGETVTGTNGDGNSVSFVTSAAESAGPFWYDWTVFGQDTTTYGTMPESSTLVALYRGRLVLNDTKRPQAWYMSKIGNPWKFLYDFTNDADLSAVTYTNTYVGEIGDIITAFIPYKDDLFIFGCANSVWILIGDPLAEGQIAEVTHTTGIWGPRAWCIDDNKNLYFLGEDGVYRMPISETSSPPVNVSKFQLPNLMSDLDLDQSLHRVVLSYDPVENGVIISKTTLSDGSNVNYFFSLITNGYFHETYPDSCGILSSYYYPATDATYKKFLVGCPDGYIREFDASTKNDATTSSTAAISSYFTIINQLSQDEFSEGMLREFTGVVAGGAASGDFTDSDGVSIELHKGNDAETVLEDIKDGATAFKTITWSSTGKQNKSRPRTRGTWLGIKVYNSTASQTWALEKLFGDVTSKGKK